MIINFEAAYLMSFLILSVSMFLEGLYIQQKVGG